MVVLLPQACFLTMCVTACCHVIHECWYNNFTVCYFRCILEKQETGYSHRPHMDEAYEPIEGKEKSFISIYVFLNDDYEGGQSSFLKNWQPSAVHDVQVQPTTGVYRHNSNSNYSNNYFMTILLACC